MLSSFVDIEHTVSFELHLLPYSVLQLFKLPVKLTVFASSSQNVSLKALDTPHKVRDFVSVDRATLVVVCLSEHALKLGLEMLTLGRFPHPKAKDVPDNFTSLL